MIQKVRGFHLTSVIYILMLLAARFIWMPYTGPMTLEWQFYLMRWVYYAVMLGAANLYLIMTLENFKFTVKCGVLAPMGTRIVLDGLILLSVRYLPAISCTVRYLLDILFLIRACILITWQDREWYPRGNILEGRRGRKVLAAAILAAAAILVMIAIIQWETGRIAYQYVMDSPSYQRGIRMSMIKASLFSSAISFLVSYALLLWTVDQSQKTRLRKKVVIHLNLLFALLFVVFAIRVIACPAYLLAFPDSSGAKWQNVQGKGWLNDPSFYEDASQYFLERYDWNKERVLEGQSCVITIQSREQEKSLRFQVTQEMDYINLEVDKRTVYFCLPYALYYFDGEDCQIVRGSDIAGMPYNSLLVRILETGISSGDFFCFEYGGKYLLKYDRAFIERNIQRYQMGQFTEKEKRVSKDIRLEYIIGVANRMR